MRDVALIGAAGLLAYGAYVMSRRDSEGDSGGAAILTDAQGILTDASQGAAEFVDNITGGRLKLSSMASVTAADINDSNVQALLAVIRRGEGTADEAGFSRLFGGGQFASFADHPRQAITRTMGGNKITSTAAGAFQFLASTWDETARIMGLSDFTPASQIAGAVGRIAARGALDDAKAGRFDAAIQKVAREWASMPGSPYGQPVISIGQARGIYASAGGALNQA